MQPSINGFGSSISGGIEVDANARPDIAIGAMGGQEAVVLRSLEVIRIRPSVSYIIPQKAVVPSTNSKANTLNVYV